MIKNKMHWIKLLLYRNSFHILFRKYRDAWFKRQLQELITETLNDMTQGFMQTAFDEGYKILDECKIKRNNPKN
ncbi:MAG TPA: hypothetical protein ENH82_16675 [bacterium]|nr:hypothetical protein [bacterium]